MEPGRPRPGKSATGSSRLQRRGLEWSRDDIVPVMLIQEPLDSRFSDPFQCFYVPITTRASRPPSSFCCRTGRIFHCGHGPAPGDSCQRSGPRDSSGHLGACRRTQRVVGGRLPAHAGSCAFLRTGIARGASDEEMGSDVEIHQCPHAVESAGIARPILAGGLFRPLFEKRRPLFREVGLCGGQSGAGGISCKAGGLAISGADPYVAVLMGRMEPDRMEPGRPRPGKSATGSSRLQRGETPPTGSSGLQRGGRRNPTLNIQFSFPRGDRGLQ